MTETSQCFDCKHYHDVPIKPGEPMTCSAFPKGIPKKIIYNDFDHRKPYPNDHGIRFEPTEEDSISSD